ncbi:MAG: alpha/beta hydrolase [Proteobacteria bacterium]|nr:alpha/beta hydrolase [Pseudomonadota bacterium]
MRVVILALAAAAVLCVGGLAAAIAFSRPAALAPMTSVENAFDGVDFSDLPAVSTFAARDGTRLGYRAYRGDPQRVVVLIHGSSGTSASMHAVARAIHEAGATVYALSMRGHDGQGRSGDVDYIGQLEDDVVDLLKVLGPRTPGQTRTLLGFSSGGGFTLRFAGSPNGGQFDRLILISPQFPHDAPTVRQDAGGWVSVAIPRYVGLSILTRFGITAFNGLTTLGMAVDPARAAAARQTSAYSFRMMRNFGPSDDYLGDFRRFKGPITLLAGAKDEIFLADRFAPVVKPARRDVRIEIVPGIDHMGMTTQPTALAAIVAAAR